MTEEEARRLRVGDRVWAEEPPGERIEGEVFQIEFEDTLIGIDWDCGTYRHFAPHQLEKVHLSSRK